eukprot:m.450345 g.450345  ORF g.450345 m.450345 type:complete len:431 (-) comp19978_c0_seq1:1424-2716(-)
MGVLTARPDLFLWNGGCLVGLWLLFWVTGKGFFSVSDFEDRVRKDELAARAMAALLGALAVQVVLRVCAVAVFGKHGGHNMERNVSEVFRTVAPVLMFNTVTVPWATGADPFDAVAWAYWFSFCACVSGTNAMCRQLRSNSPDQRELIHMWGSVSVPRDVILAISVLAVNLVGLSWLLWQAPGLSALTPAVWIKWGHESIKDLVVTATLLSQQYLRTCEDGYVMGWSIAGIEFEVESCGKIIWRVLHLLSSGYLLWEDGFSTFAVDIMVYFRLRSSWRILGLEIAKRLSRADVTMQIDQLYPQTKLTETDDNQCPICWEEMPAASVLPCKHRFHRDCLRDWVKEQGSCPTCRHPINMIAPPGTHLRDGVWHETLRRLFSLGGPTPQEIEQMTLQLHRVFPNVAIAAIEHDLVLTGSVEVTADRLTRGQVD